MPDSEARNVPLWKRKHSVRTVKGALLQAGDEGEDSEGYAVFRTEDASVSSGTCSVAFDMQ